jgi:hypothetical protein
LKKAVRCIAEHRTLLLSSNERYELSIEWKRGILSLTTCQRCRLSNQIDFAGAGTVPKAARDPKRTWSPSERAAQRAAQGDQCANGCGTQIDAANSEGHHIERMLMAGAPTTSITQKSVSLATRIFIRHESIRGG